MAGRKPYSKYKIKQDAKSKAARTVYDEHTDTTITFDSNIEKKYYDEVVLPGFKSGEIINYELQKKYNLQEKFRRPNGELIRAIDYVADYWVKYKDGHEHVIDVKGNGLLLDGVCKIKKKLMYYKYPEIDFEWITWGKDTGWINWDLAQKMKRDAKKAKKAKESETK